VQGRLNQNMDKNINDNDRIVIGVREWVIQQTLLHTDEDVPMDVILNRASRLEKFVLGGIKEEEKKV